MNADPEGGKDPCSGRIAGNQFRHVLGKTE